MEKKEYLIKKLQEIDEHLMEESKIRQKIRNSLREIWKIIKKEKE